MRKLTEIVADELELLLGEERFKRWKKIYNSPFIENGFKKVLGMKFEGFRHYTFKDLYSGFLGEGEYYALYACLSRNLEQKNSKIRKVDKLKKRAYRFFEIQSDKSIYEFTTDAVILNSFSYPAGLLIEKGIFGVSWNQHFRTRYYGLYTNTIGGDLYGMWNDHVFEKWGVKKESNLGGELVNRIGIKEGTRLHNAWKWFNKKDNVVKRCSADTYAFAIGQFAIYFANMSMAEIPGPKGVLIGTATSLGAGILGMVYGPMRRRIRFWYGLEPIGIGGRPDDCVNVKDYSE